MRSVAVRAGFLLTALAALVVVALTVEVPDISVLRAWIVSLGPVAPLAFVVGYAVVVPAPVPKSVLTTVAGIVFGIPLGIPVVIAGATAGAVLAFLIARVLGRDAVDAMARGHLDRVDAVIERHGVLAALVVRIVPVLPFTLLNYACGVTAMRLRHYALGTAVGVAPGTSAVVALGSAGAQVSLWVPALASVTLGLLTIGGGLLWHHRSKRPARSVGAPPGGSRPTVGHSGNTTDHDM